MFDVKSELLPVATRWKHIGLALRLDPAQLDTIEMENRKADDCLTKVVHLWLKKEYNRERFGEPSWTLVARAVGHPAGGNDRALAEKIAEKYGGSGLVCVDCGLSVSLSYPQWLLIRPSKHEWNVVSQVTGGGS